MARGPLAIDASVAIKWYVPEPGSTAAAAEGGRLVTADEKLVQATNRTPLQPFVRLLGSFASA